MTSRFRRRSAVLAVSALLIVSAAMAVAKGPPGEGRTAGDRTAPVLALPILDAIRAVDPEVSRPDTPTVEKRSRPGPLLFAPASGTAVSNFVGPVSMAPPPSGEASSFIAFRTPLTRAPPVLPAV